MITLPIAVLVSGNGSNLQAIIDAIEKGSLHAEIKVVISDKPEAFAIRRCLKHNIFSVIHDRRSFKIKLDFENAIEQSIRESGAELICLAGFMRILSPEFVSKFKNKIVNIHPALLPKFRGLHAQKQALDAGSKISGCTVHFVDEGTDTGPIILQASVPVLPNDTVESLSARILSEEHRIYPAAIELIAEGKVRIKDSKVLIGR